jgi:beta-lactamase superfamily II metal-dependent hydrolase
MKKILTVFVSLMSICILAVAQGPTNSESLIQKEFPRWKDGFMDIHSIATGQGDCTFIVLPDGTTWLIDAGDMGCPDGHNGWTGSIPDGSKHTGEWIKEYINHFSPRRDTIDYAMITHFHSDHVGSKSGLIPGTHGYGLTGITMVGDIMHFNNFIDRDYPSYDFPSRDNITKELPIFPEYRKFVSYLDSTGTKVQKFQVGTNRQFVLKHNPKSYSDAFEVRNLCANGEVWTGKGQKSKKMYSGDPLLFDENMNSCGVLITYGKFKYYNCGDLCGHNFSSYKSQERHFENEVADVCGQVTVIKNDHHGWKESTNAHFLQVLKPQAFVVMVSNLNHPYYTTVQRMIDPLVYDGPREIYFTSDASKPQLGDKLFSNVKPTGHIIIRVYPGGKSWQVFVLDPYSSDYSVKYVSELKQL